MIASGFVSVILPNTQCLILTLFRTRGMLERGECDRNGSVFTFDHEHWMIDDWSEMLAPFRPVCLWKQSDSNQLSESLKRFAPA